MTREHLEQEGLDIKSITSGGASKRGKSRGNATGTMSMSGQSFRSKKGNDTEISKVIS